MMTVLVDLFFCEHIFFSFSSETLSLLTQVLPRLSRESSVMIHLVYEFLDSCFGS